MTRPGPAHSSLLRNSVFIMMTTGVNSALGYVFWLVVAHSYPASRVGVAAALISAMTFIAAIANLGTSPALVQLLPRCRTEGEWSRIVSTSLATGAAAGFVVALVCALLILPSISHNLAVTRSNPAVVVLFAVGVALWSVSLISDYLFIAERSSQYMAWRNLVFAAAKLLLVTIVPVFVSRTAASIFGSWILGCALSLVFAYAALMPRLRFRLSFSARGTIASLGTMVRPYLGNYLTTLGNVIPFALLPVFVIARLSAAENAYFYVTWLLGGAFFTISSAVGSALFAEGAHDIERIDAQMRSAIKITAALLIPMMLFFFVAGSELLGLFGSGYADHGTTLLIVLTASAVPDAITNLYIAKLRAQDRLGFAATTNLGMAVITLGGSWLLLEPMGITGAGVAWLVAESAGSVAVFIDVLRHRSSIPDVPDGPVSASAATTRSTATTAPTAAGETDAARPTQTGQ